MQAETPLRLMLRRGKSWQEEGKVYHAIGIYYELVEDYPDSDEAKKAREALMAIARNFEQKGRVYAANAIYRRLASSPVEERRAPRYKLLSPMGR